MSEQMRERLREIINPIEWPDYYDSEDVRAWVRGAVAVAEEADREIDRLHSVIDAMATEGHATYKAELDAKDREINRLTRELAEARGVIAPFADAAPPWDGNPTDKVHVIVEVWQCGMLVEWSDRHAEAKGARP